MYRRVIAQPVLRRLLPGMAVSALGDGMSMVAVAWLAVLIAPAGTEGVWTGLAVAAYSLPATVGAAVFGRFVRGFSGTRLVAVDASLRAVALGTVAVLAVAGALAPAGYVALLAVSSLLHAWGNAGTYTLIAEVLPDEDRVAGNALVSTFNQASFVVGPALAGAVTALTGPGWVIGADAVSFAVLAVSCWLVRRPVPHESPTGAGPGGPPISNLPESTDSSGIPAGGDAGGWRTIVRQPRLLGLIAVTCVFFFLYGPVEVALPIRVAAELHGSPGLLGVFWTVFGIGAVVGGLGAGLLRNSPLWAVVVLIVVGWGAALVPLGVTDAVVPGLVGFAVGGLIYGPFTAICTTLFQRACPPSVLSRVLATRTALTTPSTAAGMLVGGPLVTAIGGRETLLASAVLTIALGLVVGLAVRIGRSRRASVITDGSHGIDASALTRPETVERVDT